MKTKKDNLKFIIEKSINTPHIQICLLAIGILLLLVYYVNTDYILTSGMNLTLNDQVNYISVARNYIDTGELKSSIVYPFTLKQDFSQNYLYMPGHFFALALSYLIIGYSPFHSFIPCLLGYLIASCAFFDFVFKLYGRTSAYLATFIFMAFPVNLIYSCTAMSEMTLIGAAMLCLSIFVRLPRAWKPFLGSLLLCFPVVFRETNAILLIPMIALIIQEDSSWLKRPAILAMFSLLFISVTVFIIFGDRPSRVSGIAFNESGNFLGYGSNAFQQTSHVTLTPLDWISAIIKKISFNSHKLVQPFSFLSEIFKLETDLSWFIILTILTGLALTIFIFKRFRQDIIIFCCTLMIALLLLSFLLIDIVWGFENLIHPKISLMRIMETGSFYFILLTIPVGFISTIFKRDFFIFGCTLMITFFFLFLLSMYSIWGFAGLRVFMICLPFGALIISNMFLSIFRPEYHRKLLASIFILGTLLGGIGVWSVFKTQEHVIAKDLADTSFLESLNHDDNHLLVAPYWLALNYVLKHYPVEWSLMPANLETLKLLNQKYQIGTIVLPINDPSVSLLPTDVESIGFRLVSKQVCSGNSFLIFK